MHEVTTGATFQTWCAAAQAVVARDPGGRGAAALVVPGDLAGGALALWQAPSVLVATGFPQPGGVAETDGPPGAAALAAALAALGKRVALVAEEGVVPAVAAALEALRCPLPVVAYPLRPPAGFAAELLAETGARALVSVERPGRSASGHYHNMRGEVISDRVAPVDDLFLLAAAAGLPTVAVGDGGNEIGMGKVAERVRAAVPGGEGLAAATPCTWLVAAGVSNWGAWALAGALGRLAGRNLLPTVPDAEAALAAVVAAGAIDGVTGRQQATVDGLPPAEHAAVLQALWDLATAG